MECTICNEPKKYKCPICRIPYCSIECYKKHKQVPCEAVVAVKSHNREDDVAGVKDDVKYDYPTEDTVPVNKLRQLAESKEVKECLKNPNLRKILSELDRCERPDTMLGEFMQEPIFTEFVDACLNVVEPRTDDDVK